MNWSNSTAVIQYGRIRHWFIAIERERERERLGSFIAKERERERERERLGPVHTYIYIIDML